MSAAGRLWRRAPAWRLCLIAALAATALAAFFPHAWPAWVRAPGQGPAQPAPQSRFTPQAALPGAEGALLEVPSSPPQRSGTIPFAGRQLPLPAGSWQTLALARTSKPVSGQIEVFGRVEAGALTGLLLAAGSDPVAVAPSPFNVPQSCEEPDSIEAWVAPEPFGQDPLTHECWRLAAFNPLRLAERGRLDGVLGRALLRVEELGVKLPDHLLLLHYLRSDPSGFLTALVFLPDTRGTSASGSRRWSAWVRRYVTALHDGYGGVRSREIEASP